MFVSGVACTVMVGNWKRLLDFWQVKRLQKVGSHQKLKNSPSVADSPSRRSSRRYGRDKGNNLSDKISIVRCIWYF